MKEQKYAVSYARFSTPEQAEGDSLRRQIDLAQEYADKNGLILINSLSDLGKSGFHGIHVSQGALGEFLKFIEEPNIKKPSVLIVENLDRLSRENPFNAFGQFSAILSAGIEIVTLGDRPQIYTKEADAYQLIHGIIDMDVAYKHSKRKSDLHLENWEGKRKKASDSEIIMTKRVPAWVDVIGEKDEKKFLPKEDVKAAINLIYKMKLAGKGSGAIANELNQMPDVWKPPQTEKRNKTGGWRKSYINKLLWNNRTVIGEFQPCKIVIRKSKNDRKYKTRVPEGKPIPNYYPPAIDVDLYNQVQKLIAENRTKKGHAGGQTGKASSIFTHTIFCANCGSPMHYINKGKNWQYLHCDRSRRKLSPECDTPTIRYDEFYGTFLRNFKQLNIDEFLPGTDERQAQISHLRERITSYEYQSEEIEKRIANIREEVSRTDNQKLRDGYNQDAIKLIEDQELIVKRVEELRTRLEELENNGIEIKRNINQFKMIEKLLAKAKTEEEEIEIRLRLRAQVRRLFERIEVDAENRFYMLHLNYRPTKLTRTRFSF